MSTPVPAGRPGFIPHLVCDPCPEAIEFYKKAFGATEMFRLHAADGEKIMHCELVIGDAHFFIADDFPEYCDGKLQSPKALGGSPVTIHRYVEDVDAAMKVAEDAGATVRMPATDMFWGDRYGVVVDPFGHNWSLATPQRQVSPEEIKAAVQQMAEGK
ncbi:VOC family protein [Bremerella cremea]|uniref:VOC family protein n=1 Tax=Bremerella cremea TaxID=1031537 RepID=UPI0031EC2BDB